MVIVVACISLDNYVTMTIYVVNGIKMIRLNYYKFKARDCYSTNTVCLFNTVRVDLPSPTLILELVHCP